MAKNELHSLLAVEGDLKNISNKVLNEAASTFTKKGDHFEGLRKLYTAFSEEEQETNNIESKNIVTTVAEKLDYITNPVSKSIDATISKEETNASGNAKAEVEINGINLGALSATALLALEKELVKLRGIYSTIPTLDPSRSWRRDESEVGMRFITDPVKSIRTQKVQSFTTVAQATKEHPAQVAQVTKDVNIGKYETTYVSGKITPLVKSRLLGRIDNLIEGVKKARSVANQAEVVRNKLGEKIFSYIHGEDLK